MRLSGLASRVLGNETPPFLGLDEREAGSPSAELHMTFKPQGLTCDWWYKVSHGLVSGE